MFIISLIIFPIAFITNTISNKSVLVLFNITTIPVDTTTDCPPYNKAFAVLNDDPNKK